MIQLLYQGRNVGGSTPANDLTFTINSLVSTTHSNVVQTSGPGSGAKFDIVRDGSAAYTVSSITDIGTGYAVGNQLVIAGTSVGGATPANDLTLTVATLSHPTIAAYQINTGLNTTVGGTGWGSGLYYGVTNNAVQTTLNEGGTLSATDTTVTVTTSAPGGHQIVASDVILVGSAPNLELMLVTNVSSNNLTVVRGYAGTGASTNVNTGHKISLTQMVLL